MILGGLWYSKDKPTMTTFLRPLIDDLNDLYVNGKHVSHLSPLVQAILEAFSIHYLPIVLTTSLISI